MKKADLIGHNYLKDKFYEIQNNNKLWNIEDYEDVLNYCENLNIENNFYTDEMEKLDEDFTFEELCEIIPKRPN